MGVVSACQRLWEWATKNCSIPTAVGKTLAIRPPSRGRMAGKKSKKTTRPNRRKSRRHPTSNLRVTEYQGDYRYAVAAGDLSEGGIFLKSRCNTTASPSLLTLHLGSAGSLQITALPVYDRLSSKSYGTGYRFIDLSTAQAKVLRSYLRNLD